MRLTPGGARQTVVLLVPGTRTDGYGDPVEDWDTAERVPLRGAWVQTVESSTPSEEIPHPGRRPTVTRHVLYLPGACPAAFTSASRVEVDGHVWRVDGAPVEHRNRTRVIYTSSTLSRVEG